MRWMSTVRWLPSCLLLFASPALAGALNRGLDWRGPEESPARFSLELAYQRVDQDQVRVGTRRGTVGEIPAEHDEVVTLTEGWLVTGRARLASPLTIVASVPYLDRTHAHLASGVEKRWSYTGLGDLTVLGTYTPGGTDLENGGAFALQLGFRAPTGERNVDEQGNGSQPDPNVRPSDGSWSTLAGLQLRHWFTTHAFGGEEVRMPFTLGVLGRVNGEGTDAFQAGNEVQVNGSGGWGLTREVSALLQVNVRVRGRDSGGAHGAGMEGLDENSGGQSVYVSPGLLATFGRLSTFGYVQIRAYERVNGIQVISPMHVMVGTSYGL